MGLADVQLILAGVAGLKALDVVVRTGRPLAAAWAAAALLSIRHRRLGAGLVAVVAFGSNLVDDPSNHQTLIGWVGLAVVLFGGRQLEIALHATVCSVYVFAVANKIAGGAFLAGAAFVHGIAWSPVPVAWLGVGALMIQVWLVWAVWRRDWTAIPAAVVFHVGVVVFMSTGLVPVLRLSVFNGLMLWLVWWSTRPGRVVNVDLGAGDRPVVDS